MNRHLRVLGLAVLLSTAGLASNASAQTGPISGPAAQPYAGTGPISAHTAVATPVLAPGLSDAELVTALRQLDPGLKEPRPIVDNRTGRLVKRYTLALRVGDVSHRVLIYSESGTGALKFLIPLTRRLQVQALPATFQSQLDRFNGQLHCHLLWHTHREGRKTLCAEMATSCPSNGQAFRQQLRQLLREIEQARAVWASLR